MNNLFSRRMQQKIIPAENKYNLASKFISNSNIVENVTFMNDPNYHYGMLYSREMEPLGKVDFKLQKSKSYDPSQDVVDYTIQFRPNFHPEKMFKSTDGRERCGFYIDVIDPEDQDVAYKWIVYGKDERHTFDRYIALKCNYEFEWVTNDDPSNSKKVYHHCLGILRDSGNENSTVWRDTVVETMSDQTYFCLPTTDETRTIDFNTRFMLSDNPLHPKIFRATKVTNTAPFGITKCVLSQDIRVAKRDFNGTKEEFATYNTAFPANELTDFEDMYGGNYHQICDAILDNKKDSADEAREKVKEETNSNEKKSVWELSETGGRLCVNAPPAVLKAKTSENNPPELVWHLFVDDIEYAFNEDGLQNYFDIKIENNTLSIKAISQVMVGYKVKIAIYDNDKTYYDDTELEVVI